MAYVKTNWVDDVTPLSAMNMNNIEDGLAEHKAELASKHIRETGSNVNGSYIKFDDGTMICFGKVQNSGNINIARDALYRGASQSWTFPSAFIFPPITSVMPFWDSSTFYGFCYTVGPASTSIFQFGFMNTSTVTTSISSIYAQFISIGRWKV